MTEEYEIIFITEEGRAIKNNKTGKIYHSEFEIIEEKNKEINRLNNIINELEKYIKTEIPEEEFVNSEWYVNILDKLKALKEEQVNMTEEIKEAIEVLPKTNDTISAYGSIDINELYKTIEKFKKVPDYNKLIKDNNNLQQKVEQLENIIKDAIKATKDVKQFVYDELVDRNVSGATETHCKIMDLLNILNKGSDK